MKSECELVEIGEVKRKGRAADKITVDDKTFYTCFGYLNALNDGSLRECMRCKLWYKRYW